MKGFNDGGRVRWGVPRTLLSILALTFFIWMIAPAFSAMYVEVYMARLQSMAILLHRGLSLALDDQAYPINTEFLYVTRLGMVQLIRAGVAIFGAASIWSVRAPMLVSFAILGLAGVAFARRWSSEPRWALAAMLILTPGILEPSFFLADNLPSAALAILALALVSDRVSALRWLAIGALMGCATLVRLDAILVAPMLVGLLWLACRDLRRSALAILYGLCGATVIFLLSAHFTGVSLPLAFRVGRSFSAANGAAIYGAGLHRTALTALGFFGLITAVCLPIGVWENVRRKPVSWSIILALMPGLFYLVFLPKANEIRDFSLLAAPFVLLHGATGLRRLLEAARQSTGATVWAARAVLLFFLFVLFAPPAVISKDGPRTIVGRAYSPVFWRQWQARTSAAQHSLIDYVDSVHPGQHVLVVQSFYEPDRYLHLALLQKGFQILPASGEAGCSSIETYARQGTMVVNLRTEDPYGIVGGGAIDQELAAMQFLSSLQCLRGQPFGRITHTQWGLFGFRLWPDDIGDLIPVPSPAWPIKALHGTSFPQLRISEWSPADLSRAEASASDMLAHQNVKISSVPSSSAFHEKMQNRLWKPGAASQ
jgi:hypothetical protein